MPETSKIKQGEKEERKERKFSSSSFNIERLPNK
jgi:hypothetical protein